MKYRKEFPRLCFRTSLSMSQKLCILSRIPKIRNRRCQGWCQLLGLRSLGPLSRQYLHQILWAVTSQDYKLVTALGSPLAAPDSVLPEDLKRTVSACWLIVPEYVWRSNAVGAGGAVGSSCAEAASGADVSLTSLVQVTFTE